MHVILHYIMVDIVDCIDTRTHIQVPLKSIAFDLSVHDIMCALDITFSYINTTHDTLETLFTFPVDVSTALVSMIATTPTITKSAKIIEKQKAKAIYTQEKIKGNNPIMVTNSKTTDVIKMDIGKIAPNEWLNIKISVAFMATIED